MSTSGAGVVKGVLLCVAFAGGLAAASYYFLTSGGAEPGGEPEQALEEAEAARADPVPATLDGARAEPVARAEESVAASDAGTAGAGPAPAIPTPRAAFLRGTVTDEQGRPIPGASVQYSLSPDLDLPFGLLVESVIPAGQPSEQVETSTDRSGRFELAGVPRSAGAVLVVEHPDYQTLRRQDLHVPEAGLTLGDLAMKRGAAVHGRVLGPGGEPVPDATVVFEPDLRKLAADGALTSFGGLLGTRGSVETDAGGAFRLTGLAPVAGHVRASKTGLASARSRPLELDVEQPIHGLLLHLAEGERIRGVVTASSGDPVADARIQFSRVEEGSLRMARASDPVETRSDAGGGFLSPDMDPGRYRLLVSASGHSTKAVDGVATGEAEPISVVLPPAGTVVVRVLSAEEAPVSGAEFRLRNAVRDFRSALARAEVGAVTDEQVTAAGDGSYRIVCVAGGELTLQVNAEGYQSATTGEFEVRPGEVTDLGTLRLQAASVLSGVVRSASTGEPVAGAKVELLAAAEDARAQGQLEVRVSRVGVLRESFGRSTRSQATDADGRFRFEGLEPGEYELRARHVDFAQANVGEIELLIGESREDLRVEMLQGGSLEGTVVGVDGAPRAGDEIRVQNEALGLRDLKAVTDVAGYYRIDHVPAGEHEAFHTERDADGTGRAGFIAIFSAEERKRGKPFSVAEGEVTRLDFSQGEKPYLYGRVECADGPVAEATVSVFRAGEGRHFNLFMPDEEATTDPSGEYRVANLEAGSYRVEVLHPEAVVPARGVVDLGSGAPQRKDWFLEGATVTGVVQDADGKGLEGAQVRLVESEGSGARFAGEFRGAIMLNSGGGDVVEFSTGRTSGTRTAPDGSFECRFVPAGKYRVSATHADHVRGQSEEFEVEAGVVDAGTVALQPAASLVVTVRSKETGRPVAHVMLRLDGDGDSFRHAVTDGEGKASFHGLKPGAYVVQRWEFSGREETQPPGRDVVVTPGAPTEVTIDL